MSAPRTLTLTELDWETIQDCLLTAIERYRDNVGVLRTSNTLERQPEIATALTNLEQQFQQQISEARALLQRIQAR